MFIGDVGQNSWEEVSFQPSTSTGGENYGWRLMEGNSCFNPATNCNNGTLTLPILVYDHGVGCSVTGEAKTLISMDYTSTATSAPV
jgi:hypothetical protein